MSTTLFALNLGPYDPHEAVATLPAQLDVLRTFGDLGRPDVALVYRLETAQEPDGDLAARFSILCVGRDGDALPHDQRDSLRDQLAVALLPGWGLVHSDRKALPPAKVRVRLDPITPVLRVPIK